MGKRTDRAFDVMRERNRRYLEERAREQQDPQNGPGTEAGPETQPDQPAAEREPGREPERDWDALTPEEKAAAFHAQDGAVDGRSAQLSGPSAEREPVKLEKGDVPAMILAGILVFGPIFLVLFGILALAWIFLH